MNGSRWWHLLFGATMAVLVGIFVANLDGGTDERIPLAAVVVMSVVYVAIGRHGFESRPKAVAFLATMLVCAGVGTAFDPNMAIVQCIAMPLIWMQLTRTRDAVVGNVLFVTAVATGMLAFFGFTAHGWAEASLIEGISLVGSLSLGLWITRVFELSDERRRLLDELRAAQSEVEALSREAGATSERERLARDLHDTIAQSLTGLVLLGQRAARELDAGEAERASETVALIEETARDTLVETRSLVAASAPVDLAAGLAAALARLAQRFERETRVAVTVEVDLGGGSAPDPALARDLEVVLLRTVQEGLANVRKHSGATRAVVSLRRQEGPGADVALTVADDGCGFDPQAAAEGFGLAGLRTRLELVAGRLTVDATPGGGTRLTATVPLASAVGAAS